MAFAGSLCAVAQAQVVTEIAAPTVPAFSVIDMNTLLLGATSVGALNAAGVPLAATMGNITFTSSTAAPGIYDFNAGRQALVRVGGPGGVMTIIDGNGSATFDATNCRIDFVNPVSTEFAIGIGDWAGPIVIDFYSAGAPVTQFTSTNYSSNASKVYQMTGGTFDRVDIRASTTGGNWVITELGIENSLALCTTFASNGGLAPAGTGNYFDLEVLNPNGVLVTSLDVSTSTAGTPATIVVYLTGDTYLAKTGDASLWRKVATGSGNTSGALGDPDNIDTADFYLPPGKYGVAIQSSHGVRYTNGAPGTTNNNFFSNGDLILGAGASGSIFSPSTFTPRIWNGCIYYTPLATNVFGFNGESCPSSAGHVEQALSAGSQPKIGTTLSIDVGPLPVGSPLHFMAIGFSNTNYAGIPLPANLGTVPGANMPGCIARCAIDQLGIFVDLGGFGIFQIAVPPNGALAGFVAFTQPYVLDNAPPHGGRPLVAGDAAGMRIGM